MKAPQLGLKSEALRAALQKALSGRDDDLVRLLAHLGNLPSPRPNLDLAAAFGVEIASLPGDVASLLARLGAEDAAPDSPLAFLPIAAAHGWAACLVKRRDIDRAYQALEELAADERAPVRQGTLAALIGAGARPGLADELVTRATAWLEQEDLPRALGASSLMMETIGDPRMLPRVNAVEPLFDYLSAAIDLVAHAPRSAERLDERRRLLAALPRTLSAAAGKWKGGERGREWLEATCAATKHPDLRSALAAAIVKMRGAGHGQGDAVAEGLRRTLDASAKPPRDPSRIRPGKGRGRASKGAIKPPRIREN